MKKFILISYILCVSIVHGLGQIVITSTDMPTPTKMFITSNDTMPTVSIGNSDSIQTWDLTSVVEHTIDTSIVMPYDSLPNPSFSSANTVIQQEQSFYGYLVNSPASFELIGGSGTIDIEGSSTAVSQAYIPSEILFKFPTSFDSSFTNNYSTDAKFYYGQQFQGITVDSVHRRSSVYKTVLADAWGTLITPLGGPYNVLRIKETKEINDTVMAYFFGGWNNFPGGITHSITTTYKWWANGIGTALATASVDTNGAVMSVEWLKELPSDPPPTIGITETTFSGDIIIYPNPANDQVMIIYYNNPAPSLLIEIKNELGQLVKKAELNQLNTDKKVAVDISQLPRGIYFVCIQNNNAIINKKFVKQ